MTTTPHKKDKQKVIDEVWTEEHIRSFLNIMPIAGLDADHHRLLRAYQSMRLEDFEQFIGFFIAAGGNINATDPKGQSLLAIVRQHRHGEPYATILQAAGANG
ncbi:MAG TPA: PA4642 family protein [Pseudomonadales bacterium]|jgi:hypothetical protein